MTVAIGGARAPEEIDDILEAVIAEAEAARRATINTIGNILTNAIAKLQAAVNENKQLLAERARLQKQRTDLDRIHSNAASRALGQSGMGQLTSQMNWIGMIIRQHLDSPPYVRSDCQWGRDSYVSLEKQMQVAKEHYEALMQKGGEYRQTGFPNCFKEEVVEKNYGLS